MDIIKVIEDLSYKLVSQEDRELCDIGDKASFSVDGIKIIISRANDEDLRYEVHYRGKEVLIGYTYYEEYDDGTDEYVRLKHYFADGEWVGKLLDKWRYYGIDRKDQQAEFSFATNMFSCVPHQLEIEMGD